MTQRYDLLLKNEKVKQYHRLALLLMIINLALFGYLAFYSSDKSSRIAAGLAAGAILASVMLDQFLNRVKMNRDRPYLVAGFLLASFAWLKFDLWWMWALCSGIGILYQIAKRRLSVELYPDKIVYPSFPKKTIGWSELNNVILKDGLLTIDFKTNRILQSEIVDSETEVNERQFNEFCNKQLTQKS